MKTIFFVMSLLMQHPGTPGPDPFLFVQPSQPTFSAGAERRNGDTIVSLVYPNRENLWVCITMRKPSEPDYEPRWCFVPSPTRTETFRINRWPPVPSTDRWEFFAFVQWYIGKTDEFGYLETPWEDVR
jgi:hypothetical protein